MIDVRFGTAMDATFTPLDNGVAVAFTGGASLESPFAGRFPEASTCVLISFFGVAGALTSAAGLIVGFGAGLLETFNAVGFAGIALIAGFSAFAGGLEVGLAVETGFFRAAFAATFSAAGLVVLALT